MEDDKPNAGDVVAPHEALETYLIYACDLLTANGYPDAWKYPVKKLFELQQACSKRINGDLKAQTMSVYLSVHSLMSPEAADSLKKFMEVT